MTAKNPKWRRAENLKAKIGDNHFISMFFKKSLRETVILAIQHHFSQERTIS